MIKNAKHPNDDIILNHDKIKEAFFSPFKPQLKNAQVFLSHSHADKNKAFKVKGYLESKTKHEVFVDSLFWDYKDDVLNKLAEYDDISGIEDAFTLILRESLEYMIKKCPYFVFLQSKNSVSLNQDLLGITYSAWIYEELRIAHSIRESRPTPMMESWQVFHDISPFLENLETITLSKLSHIINS
ncbi:toll/interleukin-1 receptor domain-containing protein [Helicobacter pylori]